MTEDEARGWLQQRFGVPREMLLARYVEYLLTESERQNLIAPSTRDTVWARHIVDSAQLVDYAGGHVGSWIDVGSGAGLPGIVVACLIDEPVVLVEPRPKRVAFLKEVSDALGLSNARVQPGKIETFHIDRPAKVISARAVASLPDLLSAAIHCSNFSTIWILPKGRHAESEVDRARVKWQGRFHVEQSITDPDSGIVIAQEVRRK